MTARLDAQPGKAEAKKLPSPPTAQAAAPAGDKSSHAAFREFMHARQAGKGKAKPVNVEPQFKLVKPTAERLSKADHPLRTETGRYNVPAPIERMRNQGKLDKAPRTNEAMFTAATHLARHYYESGLAESIRSMDLTGTGGGQSTAASYMPANERVAHHRQKFQAACRCMGWYEAFPFRGSGRLVVDIICREHSIEDAARRHFPETRNETAIAAANDRLREGLFLLAHHWRLI